jgi:hypothetical protein
MRMNKGAKGAHLNQGAKKRFTWMPLKKALKNEDFLIGWKFER